jgi:hypothetical protein
MLEKRIYFTGEEVMGRWGIGAHNFRAYLVKAFKDSEGQTKYLTPLKQDTFTDALSTLGYMIATQKSDEEIPPEQILEGVREVEMEQAEMFNTASSHWIGHLLFHVKDIMEFEEQHPMLMANNGKAAQGQAPSLDVKERQELGRLRLEKEKWETSIKAAVQAALLCQGGKIKRDQLKDKLYEFDLPDTVIESIWKALREKGLTKGPGRPSKSTE